MSLFNRLFTGRGLKRLLLIICFGLLAATIWFLGPYLGFGEVRPLEAVEGRVIFLLVTFLLLLGFWFSVPVFILFALVACAMVWVVGPFILIGTGYPLKSAEDRGIIIAIIVLFTLVWGMWRLVQALVVNPALLDNFIKKKPQAMKEDAEHSEVNAVILNGVKYMRRIHRTIPLWRRFFHSSQWRTDLPWFMVMGTQSAGKTSMIFSSGQDFPLPEQLNRKGKDNQPTLHCECLFTNEALFLDTAGKYVEESATRCEWISILKALKKHRPVLAINGVIVALSAADILSKSKVDLLNIAAALRARLDELRQTLGVRFPVYVTITKLDQISGFSEYFRNLTAEEREQIWGVTFPYGNEESFTVDILKERVAQELLLLENRLSGAMHVRQQEEYAVSDRKRMYALPQDFRLLSQGVAEVLQNIFFASRYDETQFHSTLRGVYFLSNCQPDSAELLNNHTLLQKWHNMIDHIRPQTPASLLKKSDNDNGLISESAYGKHYFLKRLFNDVITRDRDLVSYNLVLQSKFRLQNVFGHLAALLVTVWLVGAFITSYQNNHAYLQALAVKLDNLSGRVVQYVKNPGEQLLSGLLGTTRNLAQYETLDLSDPELEWRYGLYTGNVVSEGADSLYHFFLQRYLLPQLENNTMIALQKAIYSGDDTAVYPALKLYLMLSGTGKFDADYLVEHITDDWEISGAIKPYEERSIFTSHLSTLFSHPEWRRYGQAQDTELVKAARALLAQKSETVRTWQHLKTQLMAEGPTSLTLRHLVGDQSSQILTLNDAELLQKGIPGIYTRDAYQQLVKKKLITSLVFIQNEDSWVTGQPQVSRNPLTLQEGVLKLYLQEYASYWQRFLASVHLISVGGKQDMTGQSVTLDIALLRTLISENSPLHNLLSKAVKETTLVVTKDKSLTDALDIQMNQGRILNQAQKIQQAMDFREQRLVKEYIDNRFSALRSFVQGDQPGPGGNNSFIQSQGTPLNRVMGILSDQYTRFVVYNSAFEYGEIPPVSDEGARFAAESQTWPDPVKNVLAPLLTRSHEKFEKRVVQQSVQLIEMGPGDICRNTLQGRYPFADSDQVVTRNDFERFFAADGVVDSWFKQNLMAKVDTATHPWRYKGSANTDGLDFFEKAATIRNAFFPAGEGKKMALNFAASVHYLSPSIMQLIINVDGESLRYSHGPVTTVDFTWPGKRQGTLVSIVARKQAGSALPDRIFRGPWAILQWIDDADTVRETADGKQLYSWFIGSDRLDIEVSGLRYRRQMLGDLLRSFRCPSTGDL